MLRHAPPLPGMPRFATIWIDACESICFRDHACNHILPGLLVMLEVGEPQQLLRTDGAVTDYCISLTMNCTCLLGSVRIGGRRLLYFW